MAMKTKARAMTGLTLGGVLLALGGCAHPQGAVPARGEMIAYVGTQADGPGQGIVALELDPRTGTLGAPVLAAEADHPTWVLVDAARHRLFTVSEVGKPSEVDGTLASYGYDPASGALSLLGRGGSGGAGPTHLALSPDGGTLFVANYSSGIVASSAIGAGGAPGATPVTVLQHIGSGPSPRQKGPHAHGVTLDPSGRFLLAADLGTDKVYLYHFDDARHTLEPAAEPFVTLPPGSGPRHAVFAPDGRHVFVLTEMEGAIHGFAWDARKGRLREVSRVALDAPDFAGRRSGSELAVSRDGRFLYAGNRGANTLQVYAVDRNGALTPVQVIDCGGRTPWGFSLAPDGRWLMVANQGGNGEGAQGNVALFVVDPASGRLTDSGTRMPVYKPSSVAFIEEAVP